MSIYVALPKKIDKDSVKEVEKYCKNIIFYDNVLELNLRKETILILTDHEEIKFCENIEAIPPVFLTDGEWLIAEDRWVNHETSKQKNPMIIKTYNPIMQPILENKILCKYYKNKNYDNFCLEAEKHIFSNGVNDIMLNYYLALVYFFIRQNADAAQQKLSLVLSRNKNFSEGWCALGDMFVSTKQYGLAKMAYENAIELGKDRNIYDGVPVWIKKYNAYPKMMLDKLDSDINKSIVVSERNL